MALALGVMAGIIFFSYSIYFARIIKGHPQEFELDIIRAMGGWMMARGAASRRGLWMLLFVSVVVELSYFGLALLSINNIVVQFLTGMIVGLEVFHLGYLMWNFSRFFKGKIALKDLFYWRLERTSAVMFFTHSFLVLVFLIAY
jgi:hypothetical protein